MPVRRTDKDVYVPANVCGRDHRWIRTGKSIAMAKHEGMTKSELGRRAWWISLGRRRQPSPWGEGACDSAAV